MRKDTMPASFLGSPISNHLIAAESGHNLVQAVWFPTLKNLAPI